MATQTQGKGKKKNKEVVKVSLDEFNQMTAPHGHSVVSVKVTGLDWAETMADHEKSSETQQIIVPVAPRAQRGPGVDWESLPTEPPFRVSLFNLPMSVDDNEISTRFFQGLAVLKVETSKSSTMVELGSQHDLYEALCKDGSSIKGRTVNVCLYGEMPKNDYGSDRYGGRGGNSYGDRHGDRNQSGGFGQRAGDRYGDRSSAGSGFGSRDRDSYGGGFGRSGGFGGQRGGGGYGDRFNDSRGGGNFRDLSRGYTSGGGEPDSEEPTNWRARPAVKPPPPVAASALPPSYNNGSRQPYIHPRSEPSHHQQVPASSHQQYQQPDAYQPRYQPHHNQPPPNNSPYQQFNNQASSSNRPSSSSSTEERQKLILTKRKTPLNIDEPEVRNEAIFGKAKPSSTPYEKMNEVEERLKAVQIGDKN